MNVIKDCWFEYTEQEIKIIEYLKLKYGSKLTTPERTKEYELKFSDEDILNVEIKERLFVWRYINLEIRDNEGKENKVIIRISKSENDECYCLFSFNKFKFDENKELTMFITNYDYKNRIENWHSKKKDYDYNLIDRINKIYAEKRIKNIEDFGNKLSRKGLSNFELLVEGKAKEWFDEWFLELRNLLKI